MKIARVKVNNRRKAFEVTVAGKHLVFPFAQLEMPPSADDPLTKVYVDRELEAEGFTYVLESSREGTVHGDKVLEYNRDPDHLRDLLGSPSTSCSDFSRCWTVMFISLCERRVRSCSAVST